MCNFVGAEDSTGLSQDHAGDFGESPDAVEDLS